VQLPAWRNQRPGAPIAATAQSEQPGTELPRDAA
jgi:hypothetical protein